MKLRYFIAATALFLSACGGDSDSCDSECVMCEVTDYGKECVSP